MSVEAMFYEEKKSEKSLSRVPHGFFSTALIFIQIFIEYCKHIINTCTVL